MCSDLSRSYLIWRGHLGQTSGCWVSWIAIRLKCLGHVTTDKFQVFSEWRFRGNYSSYTNAYARSASTYIVFPSSPWCYLFISWSVSRSCWWGFLQNGVRFSELTLKCWYCSIYSLRLIDSTTVPLGPRYKCNEDLGSDPERNQGIWWLKFSILASSLTISCTLLLVKLIILSATRSSILGEDNLQFKTDKTVLPCTKRYLWSFEKLLSYFMLI